MYAYADAENEIRVTHVPSKLRVNIDVASEDGDLICMDFNYGDVRDLYEYLGQVLTAVDEEENN